MSTQVQLRRDTAANVAAFTGKQGECIVDTTNNRLCLQDGSTAGGWPAAKLSEVQSFSRRTVADANTTITASDVIVSLTSITATRTWSLPAASSYPVGKVLTLQDESGALAAAVTTPIILTILPNGTDTIAGLSSIALGLPYRSISLRSNGVNGWVLANENPGFIAQGAHGGGMQAAAIEQTTTLSGATTTAAVVIPNQMLVFGVSMRVITAITGATSFSLGDTGGNPTRFGSSLGIAAGSTNQGVAVQGYYGSGNGILFTSAGGNFTGGVVRTTIYGIIPTPILS